MRLTRRAETVGGGNWFRMGPVYAGELTTGSPEEGAPHVLASVTLRSGRQPPVFDLSRAETREVGPAGLSGVGRRSAVGYLEGVTVGSEVVVLRHRVAKASTIKVVVEVHVGCREDWESVE